MRILSVCPSVCPSVRHTRGLWQNGRNICPDLHTTCRGGFTGAGGGPAAPPVSVKKNVKKGVRRGHPEYLKCSKTVWRLAAPSPRTPPPLSALRASHLGPSGLASRPFGLASRPGPSGLASRPYGPRFRPPPSANPKNAPDHMNEHLA